ncbi:hypothetical protein H072_10234 [Dactylellina haptotyla CBS 200.50]|uniref:Uncharacterized protein n=1 Tax=Dactylellina haptotyla (strain CBS 200.50) TaxID=1284197 RepID=S7ZZL3_DACHA|nr:hypothetical protein H072_10234 [Dactylellina haptotyla CBS 200.50]
MYVHLSVILVAALISTGNSLALPRPDNVRPPCTKYIYQWVFPNWGRTETVHAATVTSTYTTNCGRCQDIAVTTMEIALARQWEMLRYTSNLQKTTTITLPITKAEWVYTCSPTSSGDLGPEATGTAAETPSGDSGSGAAPMFFGGGGGATNSSSGGSSGDGTGGVGGEGGMGVGGAQGGSGMGGEGGGNVVSSSTLGGAAGGDPGNGGGGSGGGGDMGGGGGGGGGGGEMEAGAVLPNPSVLVLWSDTSSITSTPTDSTTATDASSMSLYSGATSTSADSEATSVGLDSTTTTQESPQVTDTPITLEATGLVENSNTESGTTGGGDSSSSSGGDSSSGSGSDNGSDSGNSDGGGDGGT